MKNLTAPADDALNIVNGQTEVIVKKRSEDGKIGTIHRGIVVQQTAQGWVRVYNPTPKTGDVSPETSEWFPLQSRNCWCEIVGQRKGFDIMPIPALLRT